MVYRGDLSTFGLVGRASVSLRDCYATWRMSRHFLNSLNPSIYMAQPYILSTACRPEKSSVVNSTSEVSQSDKPSADQAALYAAIDSATLDRVRTVLREICTENPQAFQSACDKLLLNVGTKRKRGPTQQRYEICVQCGEEYDVLSNNDKACVWHPGNKMPKFSPARFSGF
jgi:hypothetical protein